MPCRMFGSSLCRMLTTLGDDVGSVSMVNSLGDGPSRGSLPRTVLPSMTHCVPLRSSPPESCRRTSLMVQVGGRLVERMQGAVRKDRRPRQRNFEYLVPREQQQVLVLQSHPRQHCSGLGCASG